LNNWASPKGAVKGVEVEVLERLAAERQVVSFLVFSH
jgi:tRNA threonylcarbamoyladenosine modification (KEOPS) complex Cgi121 subunit